MTDKENLARIIEARKKRHQGQLHSYVSLFGTGVIDEDSDEPDYEDGYFGR
ncbi:hypothetical protein VP424E501_P0064 [Vibrio phage 424E50-1]|nr:hypothetical protein VP424E501_P0064 [Vibrio phage 424E50-1]